MKNDNTKTISLSKAQKEFMKKLNDGIVCHHIEGLNSRCFFAREKKSTSWATIYKLETLGLVERTHNKIILTEQGNVYCKNNLSDHTKKIK